MAQRFKAKTLLSNSGVFNNEVIAPNLVYNTGSQTINGIKSFQNSGIFIDGIDIGGGIDTSKIKLYDNPQGSYINIVPSDGSVTFVLEKNNQTLGFDLSSLAINETASIAINSEVVHKAGNETISGIKTFATGIVAPNLVYNTGDQNISGNKTFANNIQVSGTGVFKSLDLNVDFLNLSGVDVTITSGVVVLTNPVSAPNLVYNTGNQTISGVKTFATGIIAPNLVYNTGDQTISGVKTFISSINATGISGATIILTPNNTGNYFDQPRLVFADAGILKSTGPKAGLEYRSVLLGVNITDDSNGADLKKIYSGQNAPVVVLTAGPAPYSQRDGVTISNNKSATSNNQYDHILFVDTNTGSNTYGGVKIGGLTSSNIIKSGPNPIGSGFLLDVAGNVQANSGVFNSGIDLNHSKLIDAVPELINVTSNFNIPNNYDGRMILANSSSDITGIIPSGNSTGFNASILQIGLGKISVTGSGLGVVINSFNNQFKTAGQFAAVSLLHTGNNRYIMYGNTSAS